MSALPFFAAALDRYLDTGPLHLRPAEGEYGGTAIVNHPSLRNRISYAVQHEHAKPPICPGCGEELFWTHDNRDVLIDGVVLPVCQGCFMQFLAVSQRSKRSTLAAPRTKLGARPNPSTALFRALCRKHGIAEPIEEWKPLPFRRFRVDFAWPDQRLVVEQEGGVFTRGAHGSVSGILRDMEKYNLLTLHGFRILRFLPVQLCTLETMHAIRQALALSCPPSETET